MFGALLQKTYECEYNNNKKWCLGIKVIFQRATKVHSITDMSDGS